MTRRNSTEEILLLGLLSLQVVTKTVVAEWLLDGLHEMRLVLEFSFQWEVCISQLISTCYAAGLAAEKRPKIKCFSKMNSLFIHTG